VNLHGNPAVVYVHGLWMPGLESALLHRRLAAQRGFRLHVFRYRSVHEPIAQIAARLGTMLARIEAPQVHLLGHSLGGLVILRCLERYPMVQPGRVVFLGAPVAGSCAARRLRDWPWARRALGRAVAEELLLERARRWDVGRELGIIAGTLSLGLARLLVTFGEANDGVIAVSETRLTGAASSITVRTSHAGLLLSRRVAREAGSFLEHGRFGI
jgi:pimeloyl-ACP methyl ester carboxylesterase